MEELKENTVSELDELKIEAKELGLEFSANIGKVKLQAKIDEFYAASAEESAPIIEEEVEVEEKDEIEIPAKMGKAESAMMKFKRDSKKRQKDSLKTRVVIVSSMDIRENLETNTAVVDAGTVGRTIPLNEPVELPLCLIELLKGIQITKPVKEIKNGQPTGNSINKLINKYVVANQD